MNTLITTLLIPGILFLLTLIAGVWLTKTGKPLNSVIFNIHKLIALAATVMTGIGIHRLAAASQIQVSIAQLLIAPSLSIISLFITGALLSTVKVGNRWLLVIHNILPALAMLTTMETYYLLLLKG